MFHCGQLGLHLEVIVPLRDIARVLSRRTITSIIEVVTFSGERWLFGNFTNRSVALRALEFLLHAVQRLDEQATVLVVGADVSAGVYTVNYLAADSVRVRAAVVSRDTSDVRSYDSMMVPFPPQEQLSDGIQLVVINQNDEQSLREALEGVTKVVIAPAVSIEQVTSQTSVLIDAMRGSSVEKIIKISLAGSGDDIQIARCVCVVVSLCMCVCVYMCVGRGVAVHIFACECTGCVCARSRSR